MEVRAGKSPPGSSPDCFQLSDHSGELQGLKLGNLSPLRLCPKLIGAAPAFVLQQRGMRSAESKGARCREC
ncbi:unnamed protein product [Linum trigynum]|uniref:Uncharacterized protein n=1 Tax=Linum trigynum TaxID=586398 RepID=A0AAV2E0J1_9ROSI